MNTHIKQTKKRNSRQRSKGINLAKPHIIVLGVLVVALILTVTLVGESQRYRQFAQTTSGNHCSGLAIASAKQFKEQKAMACNPAFKGMVVGQLKGPAGCTSDAEAGAALDVACKLPESEVPASPCSGKVIASTPDFKTNQAAACSAEGRSVVLTQLTTATAATGGEASCAGKAEAEAAVNEACGGPLAGGAGASGGGTNPTGGAGSVDIPSPGTISTLTQPPTSGSGGTSPSVAAGTNPSAAAGGTSGGTSSTTTNNTTSTGGTSGGGANIFAMLLDFIKQLLALLKSNGVIK